MNVTVACFVSLTCNKIGPSEAKYLAGVLEVNQSLTGLRYGYCINRYEPNLCFDSLWENNIADLGAKDLAAALKVNRRLKALKYVFPYTSYKCNCSWLG